MFRWHKLRIFVLLLLILIGCSTLYARPLIHIQRWKTTNGLQVWYVHRAQLPMVDMRLVVEAGSALGGTDGLAWVTAHMLSAGAKGLSESAIAKSLAQSGARFSVNVGRQVTVLSLASLTLPTSLQVATAVFASMVGSPTFPKAVFTARKHRQSESLKLQYEQPTKLAYDLLYQNLYPNSQYGRPVAGTTSSIAEIQLSQVQQFYNQYYVARNMSLVLVGDINVAEAHAIANQVSTVMPMGELAKLPVIPKARGGNAHKMVSQVHHATQATILVGTRAIPVSHSDYLASLLAAEVLGGENSVLYRTVRAQNGLVYRLGAHASSGMLPGIFTLFAETRSANVDQALATIRPAVRKAYQQGPDLAVLRIAKKMILGHLLLAVASNQGVVSRLVWLIKNHLPVNYFETFAERIKQVTPQQVKTALVLLMHQQYKVVVVVGGASD